jgi:ABC-type polysaccharide/polyol phosphate export permease
MTSTRRYRMQLLVSLTRADLLARYGRGRYRLLKWLLDPFALVGVYLILVTVFLDRPGRAVGLSLACAVIPFQLLMMAVANGLDAVQSRKSIVVNMRFPRVLLPLSAALTEGVGYVANLSLFVVMMAAYAVAPTPAIAFLPLVIATNFALAAAAAFPASLIGLSFIELRAFTVSAMRTLFFVGPGLVTLSQLTGRAKEFVRFNPLTGIIEAYRDVLLYGHAPAAWELLYPLGWAALLAALFVPIYSREQRHFAKVV